MIRSLGEGKYIVVSHGGRKLSKPVSKKQAVKRLKQVEYYKHHPEHRTARM